MAQSYTKSHKDGVIRSYRWHYTVKSFGVTTDTDSGNVNDIRNFTDSLSGVYNPAWRSQIREVVSATTPANGIVTKVRIVKSPWAKWSTVHTVDSKFHSGNGTATGGPRYANGWSDLWPNASTPDTATLISGHNQAVAQLHSQLNSMASSVKSGEDWGEWKQTMRALSSPMKKMRDLMTGNHYRAIKDLERWRDPVKLAEALADTHLEWAFGWKPLASTIAQAAVGLQNREVMGFYHPFFARSKVAFAPSTTVVSPAIGNYLSTRTVVTRTSEYSETYQGVWGEECKLPEKSVSGVLGLWPRDFFPTIWNLIPYSFLADYFANVGDIVGSMAVPWGGVKWCNYTIRTTNKSEADITYIQDPGTPSNIHFQMNQTPGKVKIAVTSFNRSPVAALPVPDLEFTRPGDITARQWLNMAALAVSQSAKLLLKLKGAVKDDPKLPKNFVEALRRRERSGHRSPYPFHRG